MPVDTSLLERDFAEIRKRRGPEAIHMGHESSPVARIPIDDPSLMRITGGGIPIGRVTRMWGGPNTGKSLVNWMITTSAQRMRTSTFSDGMACAYWNIEQQFDPTFTAERGVDVRKLVIQEVKIIEDIAREMQLLLGSVHYHCIDSCSFAVSQDELVSDPGDWHRGLDARVWKKSINRIHASMDKDYNTVVLIDHAGKDQITQSEHPLGGQRLEFASDLSLHFMKGSWLFYDKDGVLETNDKIKELEGKNMHGQKEADGIEVIVRVEKSRVCRPLRTVRLRLDYQTFQFDHLFEYAEAGQYFDVDGGISVRTGQPAILQRTSPKGSWYDVGLTSPVQGYKGLRRAIESDPELKALIYKAMMAEAKYNPSDE